MHCLQCRMEKVADLSFFLISFSARAHIVRALFTRTRRIYILQMREYRVIILFSPYHPSFVENKSFSSLIEHRTNACLWLPPRPEFPPSPIPGVINSVYADNQFPCIVNVDGNYFLELNGGWRKRGRREEEDGGGGGRGGLAYRENFPAFACGRSYFPNFCIMLTEHSAVHVRARARARIRARTSAIAQVPRRAHTCVRANPEGPDRLSALLK